MNIVAEQGFLGLLIFLSWPVWVIAAAEGSVAPDLVSQKQGVAVESISIKCYESAKYFVIVKEVRGKAGSDVLVKYRSRPEEKYSCDYSIGINDFEIKNEWAEYFAGLKGDLLLLDSTTGPGPSGLTIWDLLKRKKVYQGSWSDPQESEGDSLVFWMETGEAHEENCPELKKWKSHGLGGAIETKVSLNLLNFTISKTAEKRCQPRQ